MELCDNIKEKYKTFVLKNPDFIGDLESALRWVSYIISSRTSSTGILSELIYGISNLLVLMNDIILEQHLNSLKSIPLLPEANIQKFIAALGCIEVFAELSSAKLWGKVGKWIIISCIQIMKVICRIILITKYNAGILSSISIPSLNRRQIVEELTGVLHVDKNGISSSFKIPHSQPHRQCKTFQLNSSGRIMRTIATAPPPFSRTWKIPMDSFSQYKFLAEMLHTFRPLAHLISLGIFGEKSWKPWLLACGLDIMSLRLIHEAKSLTSAENSELQQRYLLLLFYLLRSPFYDKYSKKRIVRLLLCCKKIIPFGKILWDPLLGYADSWDELYFYAWDP